MTTPASDDMPTPTWWDDIRAALWLIARPDLPARPPSGGQGAPQE